MRTRRAASGAAAQRSDDLPCGAHFRDPEAARDWLAARGGPKDLAVSLLTSPATALWVARNVSLLEGLSLVPDVVRDHRALRRHRTTRHTLGSHTADSSWLEWRRHVVLPLRLRLAVALMVLTLGLRLGMDLPTAALTATAASAMGRLTTRVAVVLGVVAAALHPSLWWFVWLSLAAGTLAVHSWAQHSDIGRAWWDRGPVFGFLPLWTRVGLVLRRRRAVFGAGVDLAMNGLPEAAAPFLTIARASPLPAGCGPVLHMAGAREQLHREQTAGALLTAREAVELARNGPAGVYGWCLAELSRVYAACGDPDGATEAGTAALAHLTRRSCRPQARRLMLENGERELSREPLHKALRDVHALRVEAVRSHDRYLLHVSEIWLVQLMLRVENVAAASASLKAVAHAEDARTSWHVSPDESARTRLMAARALVEDDGTRELARRDATAALSLGDAAARPLTAVAARTALARADELDGRTDAALAQAAEALVAVNEARYRVSSAEGRRLLERMQLRAYATALRLTERLDRADSTLAAEIIEAARGDVLPGRLDPAELGRHQSLLDMAGAAQLPGSPVVPRPRTAPQDETATFVALGLSPVLRPPSARIANERRLPRTVDGAPGTSFDLDRTLVSLAGRCWYWSAMVVSDRYYWSVRSPAGQWSHGASVMREGSEPALAEQALRDALPLAREGEDAHAVRDRVDSGALSGRGPHGREAEFHLLARVSAAFLPPPLAAGLAAGGPETASLVVALPAQLSHLPVAALPLAPGADVRVIDVARVVHVPGWAVVNRCLSRPGGPRGARAGMTLAVLSPDAADGAAGGLAAPAPGAALLGPVTKTELLTALRGISAEDRREGLLYLAGHIDTVPGNPYLSGLRVAPGCGGGRDRLSMSDMLQDAAGAPNCPVPRHVITVGCGSLGLAPDPGGDTERTPVSEWLGFGSALLLCGADHVICTLYTVHSSDQLQAAARRLTRLVTEGVSAPDALRDMQLAHLRRWRLDGGGRPFIWQAFAYTGVGG